MYKFENIKLVHLEITDRCNATCPQCARNMNGGKDNPWLANKELSINDIKHIFSTEWLNNLNKIYMCGNYGDPVVGKYTLEAFQYFRESNPNISLGMHTNGSARSNEWWTELAKVLKKDTKSYVRFGIDGLEDTNHLYRKDTNWDKIIQNAETFIKNGGNAQWDFIVFEHNEHQVEEAEKLSKKLGFTWFNVKRTGRFFKNSTLELKKEHKVVDRKGNELNTIKPPKKEEFQNESLTKKYNELGDVKTYFQETKITCKTLNENSIYISSEGLVFPCCWTANQLYVWYKDYQSTPIWSLINGSGGKDNISSLLYNTKDIVEGNFFNSIKDSWNASNKLEVCAKTCGEKFNQFKDQFKSI